MSISSEEMELAGLAQWRLQEIARSTSAMTGAESIDRSIDSWGTR
jgi:hypothetical protein